MVSSQVGRGMTKALAVVCSLLAFFEVSAGSYRLQRIQHGALEELCGNFSEGGEAADAVPAEEREVLGTFCRALNATCPERHFCRDLQDLKNSSNASSMGQNDNATGRAEVCAALDRTSLWVQVADDLPSEQRKLCTRLGKAVEERYQRREEDDDDDESDEDDDGDDDEERLCESSGEVDNLQDDADDDDEKNSTTSANHTEQGNGTSRGQLFPEEELLALCEEFGLLPGHQEPGDRDGDDDDIEDPQHGDRDGDDDDAEDPQHGDRDGDDDDSEEPQRDGDDDDAEDGEANSTQNEDGDGVEDESSTSTFTSEVESSSASAIRSLAGMSICCVSLLLRF